MPSSPPKIGLALSGGAARGMAHVGVLRALLENNIPIDCIAGTSAGSIVAGAYAAGLTIDEIADFGRKLRWRHIGRVTLSRLGLQSNARLERYMRMRLPITKFENLRMPLAIVATDLKTHTPVVMKDNGDIAFAIRASCTIPGWYVPVIDEQGRHLVDGGLVAVIPSVATRSLGADIVIAVDVNSIGATFISHTSSIIGVLFQSMMVIQKSGSARQRDICDFVIDPEIGHIRWDRLGRVEEIMDAGYEAALKGIPAIREIIDAATNKVVSREEILA